MASDTLVRELGEALLKLKLYTFHGVTPARDLVLKKEQVKEQAINALTKYAQWKTDQKLEAQRRPAKRRRNSA